MSDPETVLSPTFSSLKRLLSMVCPSPPRSSYSTGDKAHPIFTWLKANLPDVGPMESAYLSNLGSKTLAVSPCVGSDVQWNFAKFLVGRDGFGLKRFSPTDAPSTIEPDIQKHL